MNKLIYLFLLLNFASYGAGDSLAIADDNALEFYEPEKIIFTEKDIAIDTARFEARTFEKNFKSKYTDEDFVYEYKSKEKNAFDRFKEWLADILRNIFSFSNKEASMNFVSILLRTIAVIIVVFVIYLIVKAILNKEGRWIFGRNSDKRIINYDGVEKNIQNVDFEKLIQNTIQAGEKRLTIRYYYLWLLKKMSAKEIIVWDIEKTNSDYLYEIKNPKLKDDFAYSSYLYNYIWYGEFDLDEDTFEKAKITFDNTIKSI